MDAVAALRLAFDDAVGHRYESLRDACDGLTEAVAGWQPPAYAGELPKRGVGRPGTILWQLHHLLDCHRYYRVALRERPAAPDTPPPGELGLAGVLAALAEVNAALGADISALTAGQLDEPCRGDDRVGPFVAMVTRHLAWHAAQIKQTRRLAAAAGVA